MLNNEELTYRINDFLAEYGNKADLPIFIKIAMQQFVPVLPAMLAKPENQAELLGLVSLLCWVIGYQVEFHQEGEGTPLIEG